MSKGSSRVGIAIAAIAALALAAAPAEAAKKKPKSAKLKVATATATVAGFPNQATATATCPGSTKAVAGGYTISTPQGSGVGSHWLNVFESLRATENSWRVSGVEDFASPATDLLTAYAYCQRIGKVSVATGGVASLPNASGQTVPAQTSCRAGTKLLSGGFMTRAENAFGGNLITRSSAVSKTVWQVDTATLSGVDHGSTTVYAYCAKIAKLKLRTTSVAVPAGGAPATATTSACPKKTTARAGGFEALPGSVPQTGMLLYDTHRAGKSWTTAAIPGAPAISGSLTAQALCRA